MRLNKKGMEMSVNALVGIIIGLILFGTASTIFFNIFNAASQTPDQVDDRMRQQIIERFDASQRVFIPTTSKELDRSDSDATFHIAVRNLEAESKEFRIDVETDDENINTIYLGESEEIEAGETYIFPLIVQGAEMEADQSALTITVSTQDGPYGNKQVIRVNR